MRKIGIAICAATIASVITGCGSASSKTELQSEVLAQNTKVLSSTIKNQTKEVTKLNTQDFSDNPHVIDAKTMVNWVNNWQKNRPCGVAGKLIVLQVGEAFLSDSAHTFVKHDDKNVFTFNKAGGCSNTDPMFDRTDGVSVIPKAVLSGEMMDAAFMMYDIDPVNDMILIVAGGDKKAKGMAENAAATARFAWSMKYWGLKHYAVLDGNIQYMLNSQTNPSIKESIDDLFVAEASKPPMSGTHSIKEIKTLNQDVMATLTEMMDVVKNCPANSFILDSRSANEYNANNSVKKSKTEAKTCGENHDEQCFTAIEGHIKGAKHIEYTNFIVRDDATVDTNKDGKVDALDASYQYKNVDDMLNILKENGFDPKTQTLYTYCRTGTRAALPAFIGTDILHVNTKLFDGSWIEWGRLAGKVGTVDVNGDKLLNEDSPFRTDIAELTEKLTYNPSNLVAPRVREGSPLEADQYACDANKIKRDDKNYISQ
jgi:3-mercaptopyruvate sulfurtransferase SseA